MLSGSLLLDKVESDRLFLAKRLKRVLVPWLIWTLIFLMTRYSNHLTSFSAGLAAFGQIFTAEFTFLPVLFCLYFLVPFFRTIIQHSGYSKQVALAGLWFLAISLLPYWRNSLAFPAVVDNGLVRQTLNYSGYFVLGYLIKIISTKYLILRDYWQWIMMVGWLTVGSTVYLVLTQPPEPPIHLSYVAPMVILTSVISFYLLILVGKRWQLVFEKHSSLNYWLKAISTASFGVFFSHPLIIAALEVVVFKSNRPITVEHNLAMGSLAVIGSFGLVMLLNKIKWLGKLVS